MKRKPENVIDSAVMNIRAWRKTDTAVLHRIHSIISPDSPFPAAQHLWLVEDGGRVMGYTAVAPVPGLNGIYNLDGGILPDHRRQGLGSRLLAHVLREASTLSISQLSHCVTGPDSPAAYFLRHHNFFVEHEEWLMHLSPLPPRSPAPLPFCHLQTLAAPIALFRRLYDQSFSGTPWHQPYSKDEIENTLDDPGDILFLFKSEQPIGFAWLQGEAPEAAIEPIGIVREEWGKGYGRFLLSAALHELKRRGKTQTTIGVWQSNQAAIHLYQSTGFQHRQTLTYLARNITHSPATNQLTN